MEPNMHENKLDTLFKSKLEDHTLNVNPNVWSSIESQITTTSHFNFGSTGKLVGISLGTLAIGVSSWYMIHNSNAPVISSTNKIENMSQKQAVMQNNQIADVKTELIKNENPKQKNKLNGILLVVNSEDENSTSNIILPPVKKSNNSESKKELVFSKEDKSNFKSNTEEIKDRVYMAGEFVTLQFEFQNVSGSDTKKVECWVEFPEWVDVSTVKTLNHSPTFELKTEAKPKFNTYIWHAHGNFSSDLNSLLSRGFIEYTFKITETKKDSEINKIKPEVK